jgi:nitrite reductase/ring-hydroxylating ferredoxin subunit
MGKENRFLDRAFSGYLVRDVPEEDKELTHVNPGTPAGEYLRRYWQPVALASELANRPLALRILGEDLVLFRSRSGAVGLVHRHCPHRGASLEFGVIEQSGLRCCYHGWLIGLDGRVLETPAEPELSSLRHRLFHGAYPVHEHRGLIFAYMGPPTSLPAFPLFDTVEASDSRLVPFSYTTPCNWLQIGDNGMDPIHASFLHMIGFPQFGSAWSTLPELDFRETPIGMIYVTASRAGDKVWVRSNDAILPNISQSGSNWITEESKNLFTRASMTRWKVPVDNTNTIQIGWRHFNVNIDPERKGDESKVGKEAIDVIGQTIDRRSYEERQHMPSDYDVLVSQRPIAVHRLEHLGTTDRGVNMLRRLIRRGIRGCCGAQIRDSEVMVATYSHDTILPIPAKPGSADRELLRRVAREVSNIVIESGELGSERVVTVRARLASLCEQSGD